MLELASTGHLVVVCGPSGSGRTTVAELVSDRYAGPALLSGGVASLRDVPLLPLSRALRLEVPLGDPLRAADFVVAAAGRGTLLVVDDLQLCDVATVEVVMAMAGQIPIAVTVADDEGVGQRLKERLDAVPGVERVDLAALDESEAALVVAAHHRSDGPVPFGRVLARAGGNVAALVALAEDPGAPSLVAAVARRLNRIDPTSRTVLCLLALLGHAAPAAVLGPRSVDRAIADGVVDVALAGVRPRSRLDADVALALCPDASRVRLHRYLARRVPDAEAARHYELAGDDADAVACARRAAAAATHPVAAISQAAIIARLGGGSERADQCLHVALQASDAGAHRLASTLVEAADRPGDPRGRLVEARAALSVGDDSRALSLLGDLEQWPPGCLRRWAELERARALCFTDPGAAGELALALTRASDDPAERARAQALLGAARLVAGEETWEGTLLDAACGARQAGLTDVGFAADANRCAGLIRHGRATEAAEAATSCAALARRGGALSWATHFESLVVWVRLHVDAAVVEARTMGEALLDNALPPLLRSEVGAQVALAYGDGGDHAAARAALDLAGATGSELARWCDAELHALAGEPEVALTLAVEAAVHADRWPVGAFAMVTAAWAARDVGRDTPLVPEGPGRAAVGGSLSELQALNRPQGAGDTAELFSDAAHDWLPLSRRSALRCRAAAAVARAVTAPGPALDELRAIGAEAEDVGLVVLAERAALARRRVGDRTARQPVRRPRGPGLTARESEVMGLVGEGLTSAVIARRLNIAPSTVETHVQSAMGKLGSVDQDRGCRSGGGGRSMKPPVVLCDEPTELDSTPAVLERAGWHPRRGFALPDAPWDLSDRRWVCMGTVSDEVEAKNALWALVRGCALVVAVVEASPPTFMEDLTRAGEVHRPDRPHSAPSVALGADESALLALLADGLSVGEAASRLYLSLRTAQRRLASARATLGVATNRQAVLAWSRCGGGAG